jgi:hypothetical protein
VRVLSKRLFGLVVIVCAHGAHGAENGFYVGAGVGASEHDLSDGGAQSSILVSFGGPFGGGVMSVPRASLRADGDGTGWKGVLGYRFHRYLAAELEYLNLGGGEVQETFDLTLPFGGETTIERTYSSDVSGPAVSVLALLPLGSRFEATVRAGVLFADTDVTFEEFNRSTTTYGDQVFIGGVGFVWRIDERWSARVEYQQSDDFDSNRDLAASHVELAAASVVYRF